MLSLFTGKRKEKITKRGEQGALHRRSVPSQHAARQHKLFKCGTWKFFGDAP